MENLNDGSNGSSGYSGDNYGGNSEVIINNSGTSGIDGDNGSSGNNNDYQLGTPNTPVKPVKKSFWRKLIDFFKKLFGIS